LLSKNATNILLIIVNISHHKCELYIEKYVEFYLEENLSHIWPSINRWKNYREK